MSDRRPVPPSASLDFPGIAFEDMSADSRWQRRGLAEFVTAPRIRWRGRNLRRPSDKALFSAQLQSRELSLLTDEGVRRVISLRNDPVPALHAQLGYCTAQNIDLLLAGWSSKQAPPTARLLRLVDVIERVDQLPGKTLFHCSVGADRTGLAAALYQLIARRQPLEIAAQEFSFKRGHFRWGTDGVQSRVLADFAASQSYRIGKSFRDWVFEEYDPTAL